jgi:type VI secretion system protein ImpB
MAVHKKLERVRKPRVHITYEVETEGAQVVRELPFVVGVMGDFSGDPTSPLRPMARSASSSRSTATTSTT